jgi:hypothetical protein
MAIFNPGNRMTWPQIRQRNEYKGRWVALDDCRYDSRTAQPVEGVVVDVDEDLVELCSRIQESDNKHCAILFCRRPRGGGALDGTPVPRRSRIHE